METKDGRVVSGLAIETNAAGVVLKDAQGKSTRLAKDEIERMVPQTRSLMPDLLCDMTGQQVADLLAFLAELR